MYRLYVKDDGLIHQSNDTHCTGPGTGLTGIGTIENNGSLSLSQSLCSFAIAPCRNISNFLPKMVLSVISYPLKSLFEGFFPWKINKYHIHLSINLKSLYGLNDMYVGIFTQIVFKVNVAKNERKLWFYVSISFLWISNIWQLNIHWFKPVQTGFFHQ